MEGGGWVREGVRSKILLFSVLKRLGTYNEFPCLRGLLVHCMVSDTCCDISLVLSGDGGLRRASVDETSLP